MPSQRTSSRQGNANSSNDTLGPTRAGLAQANFVWAGALLNSTRRLYPLEYPSPVNFEAEAVARSHNRPVQHPEIILWNFRGIVRRPRQSILLSLTSSQDSIR